MSQNHKHYLGNSPYTSQKHLYSGSPSLTTSQQGGKVLKQFKQISQKVMVPSINIQLKNQLTLNVVKQGGSQTQREMKSNQHEVVMTKKKQIPISKFSNAVNNNYVSGYYQNYIQNMTKMNSKTQNSKETISNQDMRKNTFEERHSVKQTQNKSSDQNARTQKLSTEPSQNHQSQQKSLSSQNIMNLLNKQNAPIKSKSPVTQSVEFNFKQLLQQYQQTLLNSQTRVKSQDRSHDIDQNGFKTERTPIPKSYIIIQLYDEEKIIELKFDSSFGTTDQLITYLKSQCQNSKNIIGFSTVNSDIQMEYYLSLKNKELSILDKQTIKLEPIYPLLDQNQINLKSFYFLQCIGMGGFSRVFLVRSKTNGRFLALKLISKQFIIDNQKESIVQNERDVMVQLNLTDKSMPKEFICLLECAFETKHWVCFGMEYCPGGELFNQLRRVKRMTEDQARIYFVQVCIAIGFLHSQYVLYRDIKPENILIDEFGHLKVADFGLARPNMTSQDEAFSFCGSPEYMAPEMLQQQGHSYTVDYYCLGALLYELLTGLPPFYSRDTNQIFKSILSENLQFPPNVGSPEVRDLIRKLLHKKPEQRLGFKGGANAILSHPWFSNLDVMEVLKRNIVPPYVPSLIKFNFDPSEFEKGQDAFKQELDNTIANDEENRFKPLFENFYYVSEVLKVKKSRVERIPTRPVSSQDIHYGTQCQSDRNYNSGNSVKSVRRGNSAIQEQLERSINRRGNSAVQEQQQTERCSKSNKIAEEMQRRMLMQNSLNNAGKKKIDPYDNCVMDKLIYKDKQFSKTVRNKNNQF